MTALYRKHWVRWAWLDAAAKRFVILLMSIAVTSGVLWVATLIAGDPDGSAYQSRKGGLKAVLVLGLWIVWNLLRLIVDPIRCAITGKFLGDKTSRIAPAAPAAPQTREAEGARALEIRGQTPPALQQAIPAGSSGELRPIGVQILQLASWAGTGDVSSPSVRYQRVDPVAAGMAPEKLADEVTAFMSAYCRPPLLTALGGTDEAFLAAWLLRIQQGNESDTLTSQEKKALRKLGRWCRGWQLGLAR